jgi:dihydroneopterin aldolase
MTIELPKLGHIDLLETLAHHIITHIWTYPHAKGIRLRLEKPKILPDTMAVGVEVTATR